MADNGGHRFLSTGNRRARASVMAGLRDSNGKAGQSKTNFLIRAESKGKVEYT